MHVEICETCREVALVAPLLRDEYLAARQDVQVPAAGQVWWRAAVRARMEAAHAAARPVTWVQGLAGAAAAGLLVALIGIAWPSLAASLSWIGATVTRLSPTEAQTTTVLLALLQRSLPLVIVIAVCAMLAPVAVYLALSDD